MTSSSTADYSLTVEREDAERLINEFKILINDGNFVDIKKEHLEAVEYWRNYQTQAMLKEANND